MPQLQHPTPPGCRRGAPTPPSALAASLCLSMGRIELHSYGWEVATHPLLCHGMWYVQGDLQWKPP